MSYNVIHTIESNTFLGMVQLKQMCLNNNQITILKDSAFKILNTTLEYLDLSFNRLEIIDKNNFKSLFLLSELKLNDNLIRAIVDNSFEKLSLLKSLDLSHNRLTSIRKQTFSGLRQIEIINLEYNHIYEFNIDTLESLNNLKELNLKNNLFKQTSYTLICNPSIKKIFFK